MDRMKDTFKGGGRFRVASSVSQYGPDNPTMAVSHWRDQGCGTCSICEAAVLI